MNMRSYRTAWAMGVGVLILLMACNLAGGVSQTDSGLGMTQTAVVLKETMLAQQATQLALQATQTAAANVPPTVAPSVAPPTPPVVSASPTVPQPTAIPPTAPPPTAEGGASSLPPFGDWKHTARILLFEDMAGEPSTGRYVLAALKDLGFPYVDVKDAAGRFKEELLSGSWDLIISAKEFRGPVSGEFYVYLNDALDAGSSVVIEEWQLDSIGAGKISAILNRCGVEFQADWTNPPTIDQVLTPVSTDSPIFHRPYNGKDIQLTNPTNFWWGDYGDLMKLTSGSQAVPLWTAGTNTTTSYLVAVSCLNDRLIIQTYSTHSYGRDRVVHMWANYIFNALKARYQYLVEHGQ